MDDDRVYMIVKRELESLKTLITQRLDLEGKAVELLAEEIERRLELLNGEHDTLSEMKNVYVRTDVYKRDMDRIYDEGRLRQKEQEEARIRQDVNESTTKRNNLTIMAAVGIALIGWALTIFVYFSHK